MDRCPYCGGVDFDYGTIATAGLYMQKAWDSTIYYESSNKKLLSEKTPVGTEVCLECGHCEIYVDPTHLRKRIRR